jgi:hypothetical protein
MSAEPRHGNLSILGLHISHCRARELMGSTSSMEPFFEILTSGPLTLYSPQFEYDSDSTACLSKDWRFRSGEKWSFPD